MIFGMSPSPIKIAEQSSGEDLIAVTTEELIPFLKVLIVNKFNIQNA